MNSDSDNSAAAWITVQDAARILRRSPRSVHTYAEAGRLQVQTRGRRHLFLQAEVETLAASLPADDAPVEQAVDLPAPLAPDTLVLMIRELHAEVGDQRQQLSRLESVNRGTQILVEGVEAELARRASWPTELELGP
jgi:Helix-turn-helix domain